MRSLGPIIARTPPALLFAVAMFVAPAAYAQDKPFPLPPKEWPSPVMDQPTIPFVLIDRLEYRAKAGDNVWAWDAQGWIGGDYDKLWIKTEGEAVRGRAEDAEVQALYARRITPFWFLQAGARFEAKPTPSRTSGVLAIQGLAPYWFEVEGSAFLNNKGDLSGRFEAEYDLLFTQRLILQPRLETNIAASADTARGIGSGFNDVQFGLRLRYEIKREFAPYIGISWTRKLGNTADIARRQGEDVRSFAVIAGVRMWF